MNKPIKSPFSNVKVQEVYTSPEKLVAEAIDGFIKALETFEAMGVETDKHTLTAYTAGFLATLRMFNFSKEEAEKITTLFVKTVGEMVFAECDCDNCKL